MRNALFVYRGPGGYYSVSYGEVTDRKAKDFLDAFSIILLELYPKHKDMFVEQPQIDSLATDERRLILGVRTLVLEGMLDVPGSDSDI